MLEKKYNEKFILSSLWKELKKFDRFDGIKTQNNFFTRKLKIDF